MSADKHRVILSRDAWVSAAIDVMVSAGEGHVRVERLASGLDVSRGSFYWHFKNREDLMNAILERWAHTATHGVHDHVDGQESDPAKRLLLYMRLPLKSIRSIRAADLELAILSWARRSEMARQAVARADEIRTRHHVELFLDLGFQRPVAVRKAHMTYAFMRYISLRRDMGVARRLALVTEFHAELIGDVATRPAEKRSSRETRYKGRRIPDRGHGMDSSMPLIPAAGSAAR